LASSIGEERAQGKPTSLLQCPLGARSLHGRTVSMTTQRSSGVPRSMAVERSALADRSLASSRAHSFVHSGFPKACVSPNLIVGNDDCEWPGFWGTGFFARRGADLSYITARHCLASANLSVEEMAARLHIPYRLNGRTKEEEGCVRFSSSISAKHHSEDVPGEFIDLTVLRVGAPGKDKDRKHLLSRAAKLPPKGAWLRRFAGHPYISDLIRRCEGMQLTGFGYPLVGSATQIEYVDDDPTQLEVVTQSVAFRGRLTTGAFEDRLGLAAITWEHDLNGFSGSPVFAEFKNEHGRQCALAGMIVTGGNARAQFLRVDVIAAAVPIGDGP
jgi:hypothetical protein